MDNERQRPPVPGSDAETLDARKVEVLESELRTLPTLPAPDELWERVRERLDEPGVADQPSSARRPNREVRVALAASIAIVAAAAVLVSVHLSTGDIEPAGNSRTAADGLVQQVSEPLDHHALIATLMEQSRQVEERRRAVLAFYSPSAPERLLRAQIGGIDAALNEQMFAGKIEPKSREALLRDRVDLMADLTDIERYRQHEFVRQVSF